MVESPKWDEMNPDNVVDYAILYGMEDTLEAIKKRSLEIVERLEKEENITSGVIETTVDALMQCHVMTWKLSNWLGKQHTMRETHVKIKDGYLRKGR